MNLPPEAPALTHKQLRQWVADRLRSDILENRLQPGEWLRQERLAQDYGVSQMPVREALKTLEGEGLVEHVPYRGVRVVAFSIADVEDLYATRAFLEGRAAGEAARQITPEEIQTLRMLQDQMAACTSPSDLARYRQLNKQFHLTIVSASRRAYLERTLTQLWDAFPTMLWSNFATTASTSAPARFITDNTEHEALIAALEAHDPGEAERLARRHIEISGEDLIAVLREAK